MSDATQPIEDNPGNVQKRLYVLGIHLLPDDSIGTDGPVNADPRYAAVVLASAHNALRQRVAELKKQRDNKHCKWTEADHRATELQREIANFQAQLVAAQERVRELEDKNEER